MGAWYMNKMLPSAVNTKIRIPVELITRITCGFLILRADSAGSDRKVHADPTEWTTARIHADPTEWTTARIRRMIFDGNIYHNIIDIVHG